MSEQQSQIANIQAQDHKDVILDRNCNIRDLKTFDAIAFINTQL